VPCIYDNRPTPKAPKQVKQSQVTIPEESTETTPSFTIESPINMEIPETRERRLLEVKLMQQWITKTAMTLPTVRDPVQREIMTVLCPELAIQNDGLLYSIYAFAALHVAMTTNDHPVKEEAVEAHHRYLGMALRTHQTDISNMGQQNAEMVCLTSIFLRSCYHATLQERCLSPYTPPTQWLRMMRGSCDIAKMALESVGHDEGSIINKLNRPKPDMMDLYTVFNPKNAEGLCHLLRRKQDNVETEPWDLQTQDAYSHTIRYIGGMLTGFLNGESLAEVTKRVVVFSMTASDRFIALLEDRQPRAMVILAHFFAMMAKLRNIWWIGDTGRREIRTIQSVLSEDWDDLMSWPLMALNEDPMEIGTIPI